MKKIFFALMCIGSLAFLASCDKETEKTVASEIIEPKGALLATFDNATQQMTCHIDMEMLQQKLNEQSVAKGEQERYVNESVEVIDSLPSDESVCAEVKYTLLDVEEECSYTIWLMKRFSEKIVRAAGTDYYLDSEVSSGSYVCGYAMDGKYHKVIVNGGSYTTTEIDLAQCPDICRIFLCCKNVNCPSRCRKQGSFFFSHCYCRDYFSSSDEFCRATLSGLGLLVAHSLPECYW